MSKETTFQRRQRRERYRLARVNNGRPRLTVHRSNMNIYAQIIDDVKGITLAAASTQMPKKEAKGNKSSCNIKAAIEVGKKLAENAKKAGVAEVFFDRGAYLYHGRVKALADAAREAGLKF